MNRTAKAEVVPVRQRTQYSCMAASMSMCLKALGYDLDEDTVNRVMGAAPMKGAAWEQALACAQHFGCRATLTMPSTVEQLKAWTDAGIPVMIAWNPEGRPWSHASVVFDVDSDLNVYVADPNIPNPKETVRVVSESEFYGKWYEKFPDYLVRRPACAIEREITPEGKQVRLASKTAGFLDLFKKTPDPSPEPPTLKWLSGGSMAKVNRPFVDRLVEKFEKWVRPSGKGFSFQDFYFQPFQDDYTVQFAKGEGLQTKLETLARSFGARMTPAKFAFETWNDPHKSPAGTPYPKSKWDRLGRMSPFRWATPATNLDGSFPEPWRVTDKDAALVFLKKEFPQNSDIYTDYESDLFRGYNRIWVGLRDNRDKQAHYTRLLLMHDDLKAAGWPVLRDNRRNVLWLLDDVQKDVLRGRSAADHLAARWIAAKGSQPVQPKKKDNGKITVPAPTPRNDAARALAERGNAGAGKHHTRDRDVEKGQSRKPKHKKDWREKDSAYSGNPDGQPIYDVEIDHGEYQALSGGHDIMKRLQDQYRIEQGNEPRDPNPRLAGATFELPWTFRGEPALAAPPVIVVLPLPGGYEMHALPADPAKRLIEEVLLSPLYHTSMVKDGGASRQFPGAHQWTVTTHNPIAATFTMTMHKALRAAGYFFSVHPKVREHRMFRGAGAPEWVMDKPFRGKVNDAFLDRIRAHPELKHVIMMSGRGYTLSLPDYFDDPRYNGGSEYDVYFFPAKEPGWWEISAGMTHGTAVFKMLETLLKVRPARVARWNADSPQQAEAVNRIARRFVAHAGGDR